MPTNSELRKFVETEGWEDKDKQSGSKTGDHHRYLLRLETGEVLYTRVSHGSGGIDDPGLFAHILREQLRVTEQQFWDCVRRGVKPPRPGAAPPPPENRIDGRLAYNLVKKVGLTPEQLASMDQEQAVEAWHRYLTEGGG
jgi:hypothetical protein